MKTSHIRKIVYTFSENSIKFFAIKPMSGENTMVDPTTESISSRVPMGEFKLDIRYTGRDLIDYCTETLVIRTTMLAALLNVTERTLSNWAECETEGNYPGKFDRLKALYKVVCLAKKRGIDGTVILNVLNEPIPGDDSSKTLLYYVVDEPTNKLIMVVAEQVIGSFI